MFEEYLLVTTTVPDRDVARALADALLEQNLAASVQIVGSIESHYWWQGKRRQAEESLCAIRTRSALYHRVEAVIHELHPYDTPEIIATPVARASGDTMAWIDRHAHGRATSSEHGGLMPGRETHGPGSHRTLGLSDIAIAPIVMGAWQAGAQYWVGIDDGESTRALRAALDHGINAFDTAEEYGDGHSERILGAALEGARDRVVLMTKVFSNHLRHDQVIEACHRSLKNLRTEYIDLYQIHWPSGRWGSDEVPIEETMGALLQLQEEGKIRAIGVSNFSAQEIVDAIGHGRIDALQPPYSLFWRHIERDIWPCCMANDITILAYSSLAQGLLTGRFALDHRFESGDPRGDLKLFHPEHRARVQAALNELETMAGDKGCSMAQLCLAWTIAQPRTCAIVGARSAAQVADNAAAMALELSPDEIAAIDAIGRPVAEPFLDDPVLWTWQP